LNCLFNGVPSNEEARKHFYQTIENAICHVIQKLQKLKDKNLIDTTVNEFAKAALLCGPKYHFTALTQFYTVVHETPQNFKNITYLVLAQHRRDLFESLVSQNEVQSLHAATKIIKAIGIDIGIASPNMVAQIEDMYTSEVNPEYIKDKFFKSYSPFAIYSRIVDESASGEFREQFLSWVGDHIPEEFNKAEYEKIKEEAQKLQGQECTNYLTQQEIDVNESIDTALKDKQAYEYKMSVVVGSEKQKRLSKDAIIHALLTLNILSRR
jgi:hypothetical protein